jgi:osmotically-inducible protein OsmY
MKFKYPYIFIFLAGLPLSSCAPVIIGSGAVVGALATREKGVSGTMSDSQISIAIKAKYYQFNPDLYARVGVNVQSGEVLLTGSVPDSQWQVEAEKMAWEVNGVKQVDNHIETSDSSGLASIAVDSWITTQVKTNLLFDESIRSLNYSIKTVDGNIYIMGFAQSQEELEKVTKYASGVKGVKKVVSYVRLKEESTI